MSRAPISDNSTTVSLFPFLAVLLCTMGALLVVLVAMTRSAREVARRNADAEPAAMTEQVDPLAEEKLRQVKEYMSRLDQVRSEAARKLRDDQQRLGHLEEHMRSLQDQLKKLKLAADELRALKDEHYDDRAQAEREVARLQQLIADTREAIADLQAEQTPRKRTYTLVPYDGPNATLQRPMFVECRDDEILLQPEGIVITRDDLRPPLGAGNALASALRAARGYFLHLHPEEGRNRNTEPYALIVVRPSGVAMFGLTQRALQAADLEFGYELVEEEWDLEFSPPDPQLAMIEQQAVDQARVRQMALAAAAPRAYRQPALASVGQFGFSESEDGIGGGGLGGGASEGGLDGTAGGGDGMVGGGEAKGATSAEGGTAVRASGGAGAGSEGDDATNTTATTGQSGAANVPGGQTSVSAANSGQPGSPGSSAMAVAPNGSTMPESSDMPPGEPDSAGVDAKPTLERPTSRNTARSAVKSRIGTPARAPLAASRGEDWALRRKNTQEVPIRRTIRVEVRGDQLTVLPDPSQASARGHERNAIPLKHDTVESIDELVAAVQNRIDGWGTAGDGMYWRPVLQMQVSPDGERRADDLTRLLKNSGFELQPTNIATEPTQGESRATR